jgi:hypothetical protein
VLRLCGKAVVSAFLGRRIGGARCRVRGGRTWCRAATSYLAAIGVVVEALGLHCGRFGAEMEFAARSGCMAVGRLLVLRGRRRCAL